MEQGLELFAGLIEQQFTQAKIIWIIVGGIMILCGGFLLLAGVFSRLKGEAVTLRVRALHIVKYTPKADDSAEKIARKAENPKMAPEFEILDGTYAGRSVVSSSSDNTGSHQVGEIMQGYYMHESDEISSVRQLNQSLIFGGIFIAIGLGVIFFFGFM